MIINGCHEHLTSSTGLTLALNLDNYSKVCISPTVCSPKVTSIPQKYFFPRLKQDLMQTHSYNLPSSWQAENLKMDNTRLLDFRPLPRCSQGIHSSGMLRSKGRKLVTDVLGQPISPIFKGQAVHNSCRWNQQAVKKCQ